MSRDVRDLSPGTYVLNPDTPNGALLRGDGDGWRAEMARDRAARAPVQPRPAPERRGRDAPRDRLRGAGASAGANQRTQGRRAAEADAHEASGVPGLRGPRPRRDREDEGVRSRG